MAVSKNISASAPRRFAGRAVGDYWKIKSVPVDARSDAEGSWTHGAEEVRWQNPAVRVVAVPCELIKQVFSVGLAIRASHHSTLDATPAQLVFGRDMLFNIQSFINWKEITRRKQQSVDQANRRENSRRVDHDYSVGDQVYITRTDIHRKLDGPKTGPYPITDVYTNGTVRIQRGAINERINIRRIEPHF